MSLRALPATVFILGAGVRILYTATLDPRIVNDDHFAVVQLMLNQGRWPEPDEAWQTYQPPLYHALAAVTYRVTAGDIPPQEQVLANPRHAAGRKAIQCISTVAGISTLAIAWLMLRRLYRERFALHAAGLTVIAFLPVHIYMSAQSTNDALTYFWSSLCLYAILRALPVGSSIRNSQSAIRNPALLRAWFRAALAAALAMWTKHYGLGSLIVLVGLIPLSFLERDAGVRRPVTRGAAFAAVLALALGAWPYVRTWRLTGSPLASNYTLRPHTMEDQLPGRLDDVSFFSFHLGRLLARPWRHLDTIDSFWTQLYARAWFDHDTTMTLYQYRPWFESMGVIWRDRSIDGRERERRQLLWETEWTPTALRGQARALYILGLFSTLMLVIGVIATLLRRRGDLVSETMMLALATGLAAPFFQTVRQPFHSSMKAAFTLSAILGFVFFFVEALSLCSRRRRHECQTTDHPRFDFSIFRLFDFFFPAFLTLLAVAVLWHFLYLAALWPQSPDYFPRLIPKY